MGIQNYRNISCFSRILIVRSSAPAKLQQEDLTVAVVISLCLSPLCLSPLSSPLYPSTSSYLILPRIYPCVSYDPCNNIIAFNSRPA